MQINIIELLANLKVDVLEVLANRKGVVCKKGFWLRRLCFHLLLMLIYLLK